MFATFVSLSLCSFFDYCFTRGAAIAAVRSFDTRLLGFEIVRIKIVWIEIVWFDIVLL